MPKFLIKGKYQPEGARGLLKDGGTARRDAVEKSVKALGGTIESFYFAYGDTDVVVIVDAPDANAGLALSLAVNASGVVHISTIPLITAAEMDKACKTTVSYRAPGA